MTKLLGLTLAACIASTAAAAEQLDWRSLVLEGQAALEQQDADLAEQKFWHAWEAVDQLCSCDPVRAVALHQLANGYSAVERFDVAEGLFLEAMFAVGPDSEQYLPLVEDYVAMLRAAGLEGQAAEVEALMDEDAKHQPR